MVLDGAPFTVTVAEVDELMLLAAPQATHTFSVDLVREKRLVAILGKE